MLGALAQVLAYLLFLALLMFVAAARDYEEDATEARARYGEGDYQAAADQWTEFLGDWRWLDPVRIRVVQRWRMAIALRGRAKALRGLDRSDEAIDDMGWALELLEGDEDHGWLAARIYTDRGTAHRIAGDQARALADLTASIDLDPDEYFPRYQRAKCWHLAGEHGRAVEEANAALALLLGEEDPANHPDHIRILDLRRAGHTELEQHALAAQDLSELMALEPTENRRLQRSESLRNAQDFEGALADLDVLVVEHETCRYRQERAGVLLMLDRHEEALQDAQRAVELDPSDFLSHGWLSLCKLEVGDPEGALESLDRCGAISTVDPGRTAFAELCRSIAERHSRADQTDLALRYLAVSIQVDATCAAYLTRGKLLEDLGQLDEAWADFRTARSIDPSDLGAQERLAALEAARE